MVSTMHKDKGAMKSNLHGDKLVKGSGKLVWQRWTPKEKAKGVVEGTSNAKDDTRRPVGQEIVDNVDNSPADILLLLNLDSLLRG